MTRSKLTEIHSINGNQAVMKSLHNALHLQYATTIPSAMRTFGNRGEMILRRLRHFESVDAGECELDMSGTKTKHLGLKEGELGKLCAHNGHGPHCGHLSREQWVQKKKQQLKQTQESDTSFFNAMEGEGFCQMCLLEQLQELLDIAWDLCKPASNAKRNEQWPMFPHYKKDGNGKLDIHFGTAFAPSQTTWLTRELVSLSNEGLDPNDYTSHSCKLIIIYRA